MKYSQFERQIDNDQLFQPLAEITQQNIKGGQVGGNNLSDEIILDVAGGTVSINDDDDGFDIILFDIADVA